MDDPRDAATPRPPVPGIPPRADLGPRLLAAVGYAVFLLVAIDRVGRGPLQALDRPLFDAFPHDGPLFTVSRIYTHLGDNLVITALVMLGMVLLLRRNAFIDAGVLGLARAVSVVVILGLKSLFGRVRPGLDGGPYDAVCCSFPSGHSTESALFFMLLAVLFFEQRERGRPWAEGVAIGLAVVTAATRVILGAHWPTDVIAGLGLGWGMAGSFLLLRAWLERKKVLPNVAPREVVAHSVGLYLPQGIHFDVEARVTAEVEDVAQDGPFAGPAHPLHAQERRLGVQRLVAREHGRRSSRRGHKELGDGH